MSLVRFSRDGHVCLGKLLSQTENGFNVEEVQGDIFGKLQHTGVTYITNEILCPLEHTPIILCVGLNYRQHAEEAKVRDLSARPTMT